MPNNSPSCVLLADRHQGLLEGVRGLVESVCGPVVMVADETSLLEVALRMQPEVAIIDLSLARERGASWLSGLRVRCPELKLIVLSVHDERSVRAAVLEAGADAFVLKRAIATDLLPAIEFVRGMSTQADTPPAHGEHLGSIPDAGERGVG